MHFKDLKLAISIHFAVLLAIGMLLLNVVIISLWQKHIVSVSMNQGRGFLAIIVENNSINCEEKIQEFEEFKKHVTGFDTNFVLLHDDRLIAVPWGGQVLHGGRVGR